MSTFKKELVEKVLIELDYQKDNFGRKSAGLAEQLGINKATLSKLRKFEHYQNQINADKMQEVLVKLQEMRKQTKIEKEETQSILQYNEQSIQSLVGNYLVFAYYENRIIPSDIKIEYLPETNLLVVNFVEEQKVYKGNYRVLDGRLYLDLESEALRDKLMIMIHTGSIGLSSDIKEVFTGNILRNSISGQEIISQKILLVRKNAKGEFEFKEGKKIQIQDKEEEQDKTIKLSRREVILKVAQAMGWHKNNFLKTSPVIDFAFRNISKLNPDLQKTEYIKKFAGLYESWYCSPSHNKKEVARYSIKKASLKIKEDGKVELHTPHQKFSGFAILDSENDVLEIKGYGREFENQDERMSELSMTFALGGSWRNDKLDFFHLHGVSSSMYVDGGPIVMREVLIRVKNSEKTDNIVPEEIFIGTQAYWERIYSEPKEKRELLLFLSGQTDNYIKAYRLPDHEFKRWEDHGLLYFTSALYWGKKGEPKEALKNLGLAFSHGFCELEALKHELREGSLNHAEIKDNLKEIIVQGNPHYFIPNFQAIFKETTWEYFHKELMNRWRESFRK